MERKHRPYRPYRRTALTLIGIGVLLTLGSFPQLLAGIPLSEGFAPAGLSVGPVLVIGGIVLYFSQRPSKDDRYVDDGIAVSSMNSLLRGR